MLERLMNDEAQDDLLSRGYSRRQLARIASVFSLGAMTAASVGRPAWASAGTPDAAPSAKVRIGANECWTGPFPEAAAAAERRLSISVCWFCCWMPWRISARCTAV